MPDSQLDVEALHAALDSERLAQRLSWRKVALASGVSPSTITRLGQGKRPDVDSFLLLVDWLGMSTDDFVRRNHPTKTTTTDPVAIFSAHLRAGKSLSPESASALEEIVRAAYKMAQSQTKK